MKRWLTLLAAWCFASCEMTGLDGIPSPKIHPSDPALQQFVGARVRLKDEWWGLPASDPADLGAPYLLYVGNVRNMGVVQVKVGTLVRIVEFREVSDATSGSMPHVILELPARPPPLP